MTSLPQNVRYSLRLLIPESVINDIACFVFYDAHPRDPRKLDVTVCTHNGDVREYFQRKLVCSIHLSNGFEASQIRILRNNKAELFYLVVGIDEVYVLLKKDHFILHQHVSDVDYFYFDDPVCRGDACLKIVRKDDAVPLIYDDNFNCMADEGIIYTNLHVDDSVPVLVQLTRKLTEVKYGVMCNEQTYKELTKLRHLVSYSIYQKQEPNFDESLVNTDYQKVIGALKIQTKVPSCKVCNKKLVLMFNVINKNKFPIEDVQVLLHGVAQSTIEYITKLFQHRKEPPYWKENKEQVIQSYEEASILVVIDLKELSNNTTKGVEFSGVILYTMERKEYVRPMEAIHVSAINMMSEDIDVFTNPDIDIKNILLALMATTNKTELVLRQIYREGDPALPLPDIFSVHLKMEKVSSNTFLYRRNPYHKLNGAMVVLEERGDGKHSVIMYTRTLSQVLDVIHIIHTRIPNKIIITTKDYIIKYNTKNFSYEEKAPHMVDYSFTEYVSSILKRLSMILEYLWECVVIMTSSKEPDVADKVGDEILLYLDGVTKYVEFRQKMLKETLRGIKDLYKFVPKAKS